MVVVAAPASLRRLLVAVVALVALTHKRSVGYVLTVRQTSAARSPALGSSALLARSRSGLSDAARVAVAQGLVTAAQPNKPVAPRLAVFTAAAKSASVRMERRLNGLRRSVASSAGTTRGAERCAAGVNKTLVCVSTLR